MEQFPPLEPTGERSLDREAIIRRLREREEPEAPSVELPPEVVNLYPRFIQEKVIDRVERLRETFTPLREASFSNEERHRYEEKQFAVNEAARIYTEEFQDQSTALTNKEFAKLILAETVADAFRDDAASHFDHIARIMIDLNGLKAVNDLSGHDSGDQYLTAIADWLKGSFTLKNLEDHGCTVHRSREGGDEFSITIIGDRALVSKNENFWHEVERGLHQELSEIDVRDLLTAEQAQSLLSDAPGTFVFRATAGIGAATLEEALSQNEIREKNRIEKADNPQRIIEKLMGSMLDMSDRAMYEDKRRAKETLKNGDREDTTLNVLLSRTEGEQSLAKENERLRQENQSLRRQLESLP